ncbi:MAG TPA: protease complex subunit PrcB family protein [Clostridia bacterium]|nr:protease complex subunit PrcB family protein [Clostridia bacterium]
MGKQIRFVALMVFVLVFTIACGSGEDTAEKSELQMGEIEFEQVEVNTDAFDELYEDSEFAAWYDENLKEEGAFSYTAGEKRYVLLSAGEKNTGGYSLENIVVKGTEDSIEITADLNVPGEGSLVTQALTYPNVLLSIPADEREVVFKGFKENVQKTAEKEELLQDTGEYVGQIDPHSVEIKISGVPEEQAAKAFQLDESIRENFEERHGLQPGDKVKFSYFVDEHQRPVLKEISTL